MIDWFQFLGDNVLDVPPGTDVGCSDEEQDVLEVNALATAEDDSDCEEQCADKDTSLVENDRASDASLGYHALDDKDKDTSLVENDRASGASLGYHALDDKPASSREHEVCSGGQHKTFVKRHCKVVKQALNKWIRCFPAPYVCHEEKKRIAYILHISFEQVTTFCNNYRKRFAMVNKKNMSYMTAHRISSQQLPQALRHGQEEEEDELERVQAGQGGLDDDTPYLFSLVHSWGDSDE
jgi:hypothetical protein